jgi:hypothetical protein
MWSVTSGKRQIMMEGKEVHYASTRTGVLDHSWSSIGNHVMKVVCHAAAPMTANPGFRQYDLFIDGQSFFTMPKVYKLGLRPGANPNMGSIPRSLEYGGPSERAYGGVSERSSQGQTRNYDQERENEELQQAFNLSPEESRRHLDHPRPGSNNAPQITTMSDEPDHTYVRSRHESRSLSPPAPSKNQPKPEISQQLYTMATEGESQVSSLVGSVVSVISANGKRISDHAMLEKFKISLAHDAAEKSVLNGGYNGKPVVMSPHIRRMTRAYSVASTGRILVMCAPASSGKSTAAEFFMHGNHPFRPERSLMISAAGMKDFPLNFSERMGVKSAHDQLEEILCLALTENVGALPVGSSLVLKAGGDAVASSLCLMTPVRRFKQDIEMYGQERIEPPRVDFGKMPLLIIDDFNLATEKNKEFVTKLLQTVAAEGVFVFIMTTKEAWATTLAGLNGGSKIKPLFGNVDNPEYTLVGEFTGVPVWNTLQWSVEALRELIRPNCEKYQVDPAVVVPDGAIMPPVVAQDTLIALVNTL